LKHFETKKHKNNKKNQKKSENCDKIEKIVIEEYVCNICKYTSCKKHNFISHLTTKKHMNCIQKHDNNNNVDGFFCCCGKKYKYQSGLSKHKIKCEFHKKIIAESCDNENDGINIKITDNMNDINSAKDLYTALSKSSENINDVLVNFMKTQNEINKKLLENISNTTIYNNCNTNKMTINVFLNETCKDAMNLSDFMQTLDISIDDLMYTKEHGYIAGINNIFTKNIIKIDPTIRPFHCNTNKKQFYVKDSNIWFEDEKNKKIDETISGVSCKQIKKIQDWIKLNPNYLHDGKKLMEWQQMVQNMIGNPNEDVIKKDKEEIIEYLSTKVAMDDDLLTLK
tara:strand:- start:5162 stop:6178 length:1017 start_codon:yes stop_codon:yes gene_type:complete